MAENAVGDGSGIDCSNLPPQQGFETNYKDLESDDLHPDGVETDAISEGQPMFDVRRRPLGTSDFHISSIEGDPGQVIPWHTHTPIVLQASLHTTGRVRVSYTGNDGETHSYGSRPG